MKVELNKEACIGCGFCFSNAPENFECDENGYASLKNTTVTEEAKEASNACPVSAISIVNENE